MATIAELKVKIGANVSDFDKKLSGINAKMKATGKRMQSMGKSMSMAITAPLAAMGAVALKSFDTQIKAENKLRAALIANGQEVEATMQDYKKFASELQAISTVGDESTLQLLQVAQSMGLTGEDAKTAAKEAIALGKAMGMSEQSAIRYTAALAQGDANMLTRYLPALRSIKDQSEKVAKAHELMGKMMGAVTAEAADGLGPLTQLTNQMGDLMEEFGAVIAQGIKPLIDNLKEGVAWFQNLSAGTKKTIVIVAGLAAAIGPLLVVLGFLISTVIPALMTGFAAMTGPIGLVVLAVVGITAAFVLMGKTAEKEVSKTEKITKQFNDTLADEQMALNGVFKELKSSETPLSIKRGLINQINSEYGSYLPALLTEKSTLTEIKNAQKIANDHLRENIGLKILQEQRSENATKFLDKEKRLINILSKATGKNKTEVIEWAEQYKTQIGGVTKASDDLRMATDEEIEGFNKQKNALTTGVDDWIKYEGELVNVSNAVHDLININQDAHIENMGLDAIIKKLIVSHGTLNKTVTKGTADAEKAKKEFKEWAKSMLTFDKEWTKLSGLDNLTKKTQAFSDELLNAQTHARELGMAFGETPIEQMERQRSVLKQFIDEATSGGMAVTDAVQKMIDEYNKLGDAIEDTGNKTKLTAEQMVAKIADVLGQIASAVGQIMGQVTSIINQNFQARQIALDNYYASEKEKIDGAGMSEKAHANATMLLEDKIADKKSQMAKQKAKADKKAALVAALVNTAAAVAGALTMLPPPVGIAFAAIVGALGAMQIAAINSTPLPSFAQGGIVSAPMIAQIGDAPSGPEVVAPLSKLQSMIGGAMELKTIIRGEDIILVTDRTKSNRGFIT